MTENGTSHAEEAIEAVADLEREAHEATSRHHHWIERVTSRIGRPLTFYFVVTFVVLWVGTNLAVLHANGSTFAQIDSQRDKLDLQINLLNERRTAKVIRMLDELRRDSPQVPTHNDPEVQQLSEYTDTQEVSRAIEERTPTRPGP
jgi:uncharacterized membrane protein